MSNEVFVSAVIPTVGRETLREAVESALAQTAHLGEVIVVADTADPLPIEPSEMVRVVRIGPGARGNAARNLGIALARYSHIALLDDDDAWLPNKLATQFQLLNANGIDPNERNDWVVSSRFTEPSGHIRPRRLPQEGEALPHYLFRKTALTNGQGALHTSTLLFPRALAELVHLDETRAFHQDIDWLLRLWRRLPSLTYMVASQSLVELNWSADSVSRSADARGSVDWAMRTFEKGDTTTRSDFLITVSYAIALRARQPIEALRVVCTAFRSGAPSFWGVVSVIALPLKFMIQKARE